MATKKRKFLIIKLLTTALCVAMLLLSFFYLKDLHRLFTIASLIVFSALGVVAISLSAKFESTLKSIFVLTIILSVTLVSFLALEFSGFLYKIGDFETLKKLILDTKQWGILTFFLITLLSVVILPIPAAITILIGVAIYGQLISFVVSSIGTIIGSLICFWIGRSFGKKIVVWVFGEEKTQKYANFLAKGKFAFIFMMVFPLFPDDLICMLAGISNMKKKFFIVSMAVTRTLAIGVYCFFGSGDIIPFKGWGIPVWIGVFALMLVAYIIIEKILKQKKRTDKSLTTKKH